MKVQNFSNYTMLYEAKLAECEFLTEQNITADDIINPIEDLITEEFLDKLVTNVKSAASAVGDAAKKVYTNVKDALSKVFSGIVNFFKNFSIKKLLGSIWNKIKEIGTKAWNKIKDLLSGLKEFIVSNGLCDENNKPSFKRIWDAICGKAKGVVDWNKEGMTPDKLQQVGAKVKINEGVNDIGDDEVKYYGFFEKVAHAMGIKNARFNGVVSQIMKKGTIGLAIIGLMKMAGLSLGALSLGLSPVAMAAIGGMLLMAGLIILAIWVCKPYPTVDDCLAYLHTAFGGNLAQTGMVNVFITDIDVVFVQDVTIVDYIEDQGGEESIEISKEEIENAKPLKSMYPTMIKNLQALQSMIISFEGVSLEGERFNDDDVKINTVNKVNKVNKIKKETEKVGESVLSFSVFEKEFSKEFSKQPRNVEITKTEDYVTQAFKNITKSLKSLKDEKDKGIGITYEFVKDILDSKMDSEVKVQIKDLYKDVYGYLHGEYSKTLPDFGPLYKESVETISNKNKRKVVAEKMARLAKRTLQFEGENMYASLGEFGADLRDFNTTLKEIMASYKSEEGEKKIPTYSSTPFDKESVKESFKHVISFEKYNNK